MFYLCEIQINNLSQNLNSARKVCFQIAKSSSPTLHFHHRFFSAHFAVNLIKLIKQMINPLLSCSSRRSRLFALRFVRLLLADVPQMSLVDN